MSDTIRTTLIAAVEAGRHGAEPPADLAEAIRSGDRDLTLEALEFDSLAWMEFCILVELQLGKELTPEVIAGMDRFIDIEEWLRSGT